MCPEADNDLATLGSNTWCTLISIIINFGVRVHQRDGAFIDLFVLADNTNIAAITATRVTASAAA